MKDMNKWPIKSIEQLNAASMNSGQTFEWLQKQGLNYETQWKEGLPVLMIIPELGRKKMMNHIPELLRASFAIVRYPSINSDNNILLENMRIAFVSIIPNKDIDYDLYSVDPKSGEVFHVRPVPKRPNTIQGFHTDHKILVINEKNREVLRKLGCNFDWQLV